MEIYFNPYPGAVKNEADGIQCALQAADALSRLRKDIQNVPLVCISPGEDIDKSPSRFILIRDAGTELRLGDIFHKVTTSDRPKLQLLLHMFSRGQVIELAAMHTINNWTLANIDIPVPILELAAKNKAMTLTIPTEDLWRVDILRFENRTETTHNLWGQEDISGIVKHCIDSIENAIERFKARFDVEFCDGALNAAPDGSSWESFGYFTAMNKAKECNYRVDNDLIKNNAMPKTKQYGSLLELRMKGPGHRIFFVQRKELSPEILIGGFYQKNESMSQNEAIQNAKKRIDDYID
jgi:putative component of toxin-antitoxin plasmid stabilization module